MNIYKYSVSKTVILLVLVVMSFRSMMMCINDFTRPIGYELLFLLPLSYGLSVFLFFNKLVKFDNLIDSIPSLLLIVLCFVRNVLTPMSMVTDSYSSSLGVASEANAKIAIIITAYETFVMFAFFTLVENYRFDISGNPFPSGKESNFIFSILLLVLFIISVMSMILVPALRSHYFSIFKSGFSSSVQDDISYRGGIVTRILGTGGDMAIAAVRYVLPTYIMYKLAVNGQSLLNLILSLSLILVQCLFMTDSNAYILMLMISQFIFVILLYPKYSKRLIVVLTILVVTMGLFMYYNRFALDHYSKSLSLFLQSYVPGVANTAGVLNIRPRHNIFQFFIDFWEAIPFKAFLGYNGVVDSLAKMWIESNDCKGQICSTIGQSYYYFGGFFSPVLSCVLIQIARKCQEQVKESDNALLKAAYIYLMIYSIGTPFVYNFCIYLHAFLQRTILIFIVSYFSTCRMSNLKREQQKQLNED